MSKIVTDASFAEFVGEKHKTVQVIGLIELAWCNAKMTNDLDVFVGQVKVIGELCDKYVALFETQEPA